MRSGHVDSVTHRAVSGWAADSADPDRRLIVSVAVDGVPAGEAVADRPRKDLAALGKFGDGRHGFSFPFDPPLDPARAHFVTVRHADDGKLLPNGEMRLAGVAPAPVGGEGALTPVLVTAPGRSGTTLLMSLLAASPDIVVAELVPYELRLLSYHAVAHAVLTSPADFAHSTHPDRLEGDGYHVGFNPFHGRQYAHAFKDPRAAVDYFENFVPRRTTDYSQEAIGEFYRRLAADRGKPAARFFAEKGNNLHKPTRMFTRRAFGQVREIVILRDPRDVLCSQMAYFSSTPEKAFAQLSHATRVLHAIRGEPQDDIHFIRYEDMVRGDADAFAALSAFIGTAIEPEGGGERRQDVFRNHGTSPSPEASMGRWRSDLPEAWRDRCASEWKDFLEASGYALT